MLLAFQKGPSNYVSATEKYAPEVGEHFTTTRITTAIWAVGNDHPFLKGDLYSPVPRQTVNGHSFDISGWVLAQNNHLTAIEVWWEDLLLFETKLDPSHAEVVRIYPIAPDSHHGGFRVPVNTLMLPEKFELQVYIALDNNTKEKIGAITGERASVIHTYKPKLHPLTVIGLPRSGTTLLMNYLCNHPSIIAHKAYPYEFMVLSYWMHLFRVLGTTADIAHSTHPDSYLSDPYFIGHHPNFSQDFGAEIETWFQQDYSSNLLTFCLHSIESCYQQMVRQQNKAAAKFFAEKLHRPTPTYQLQWSLYPQSRSIFIVRDFRDRYCSALAFNEKSGVDFFHHNSESELDIISQTRKDFMLCYNIWKHNPERVHLLRYEDLIQNPHETITTLFEHLGIGLESNLLDKLFTDTTRDTQGYVEHRTAQSVADSIGRWRAELSPEQKALFQTHLGDILSEFGYEAE